jgi:hypothetical protein
MMPMDLQDRAQYLSLALFSQKIISALMEYADENRSAKLKPSLDEALASLRSVQTTRSSPRSQARVAAFSSYEHLRTLEEVWSKKERAEAIKLIQAVLRGAPRDRKTKLVAEKLIELFSKLQNQALWNFEQPKPVSRRVMQRLCQPA